MTPQKINPDNDTEVILPMLTERQTEGLVFISQFLYANKYYPSQREISEKMGFKQAAAGGMIAALEKKGYLKRIAGEHRNIRLTKAGRMKLEMIKKEEETKQE